MTVHRSTVVTSLKVTLAAGLTLSGCLITAIGLPAAAQQGSATIVPCPGAPAPHLIVGELARVTPGSPDNVRSAASKSADVVTQISQSDEVLVTGLPTCADNYLWWPVHTLNGFDGWVAEGDSTTSFLNPTTNAVEVYKLPANSTTPLQVRYNSFQLSYPPTLAAVMGNVVSTTTVSAYVDSSPDPVGSNTAYDRWGFGARTADNLFTWPTLSIYPVAQVEALDDTNKQAIDAAIAFLKNDPASASVDSIPVYPLIMSGQVLHAQPRVVAFTGGTGFRFVAAYASDVGPITNDRGLRYQFMGLTTDGRYFLSFSVPVTTVALNGNDGGFPSDTDPNIATLYPQYVATSTAKLDKAATTDFSIDLEQLDTLMASISTQ